MRRSHLEPEEPLSFMTVAEQRVRASDGRLLAAAAVFCVIFFLSGCGSRGRPPAETTATLRLGVLARLYGEYAASHQGKGPADEAAFKAYLKGLPREQIKASGLADLEAAFVSPRDGKPYVVVYGISTAPRAGGLQGQPVVMYEQAGKEGKRLVANAAGATAELSENEFRKMVPHPK